MYNCQWAWTHVPLMYKLMLRLSASASPSRVLVSLLVGKLASMHTRESEYSWEKIPASPSLHSQVCKYLRVFVLHVFASNCTFVFEPPASFSDQSFTAINFSIKRPLKRAQERPKRIKIGKAISKTTKTLNIHVTMVSIYRI